MLAAPESIGGGGGRWDDSFKCPVAARTFIIIIIILFT